MTMKKPETDRFDRMDTGRKYLAEGDYQRAEQIFKRLLREEEDPIARNNFAVSRFAQDDWTRTIEILEPNLRTEVMNPYARALAAKAYVKLGKNDLAEKLLNQAVIQFNWGVSRFGSEWYDYLLIIAETAGILTKHRMVMELHQKWSHRYTNPISFIYAGTAYFNLGRYGQAIANWTKVLNQYKYLELYVQVTKLIEAGSIPPFSLEYSRISIPDKFEIQWFENNIDYGQVKMFLLGSIFQEQSQIRLNQAIDGVFNIVIKHGGDWGEKLAREILRSNTLGIPYKMAAGRALLDLGIFAPDELIPMRVNGKDEMVKITRLEVASQNDQYDQIVQEALRLIRNKEYDRAEAIVNGIFEQNVYYPPAMEMAVRINFLKGKFAEAANLLEPLLELQPNNQHFLLMMTEIQYRLGDIETACKYRAQVDAEKLPAELGRNFANLCDAISESRRYSFRAQYEERLWRETLEKPLPGKLLLHFCLKRIPAEWLTAICLNYRLEPEKKRKDREEQLIKSFQNEVGMIEAVGNLPKIAKSLLRFIVAKNGRVKLGAITRQFGNAVQENYFWTEEKPITPLGQLISYGLVFAGTMPGENGYRYKMAVIPDDLLKQVVRLSGKMRI
jgi:tetratricopeptide (TPR) repeat protein